MGKWLRSIFSNLVANLLLLVAPLVVVLLAWLQKVPYYLIALGVIAAIGFTFLAINQFHALRARRSKGFATQSNEKIEAALREWLYRRGYKVNDASEPGTLFAFVAEFPETNRPVTIARLPETQAFITVLGAVSLSREHQAAMQAFSVAQRIRILQELRIEMARYGISYANIGDPLTIVTLSHEVLCDQSLTEEVFLRAVRFVSNGIVLLRQLIHREVPIASTSDTEGSQN